MSTQALETRTSGDDEYAEEEFEVNPEEEAAKRRYSQELVAYMRAKYELAKEEQRANLQERQSKGEGKHGKEGGGKSSRNGGGGQRHK